MDTYTFSDEHNCDRTYVLAADAQRALDAERARVKELELYLMQERANRDSLAACVDRDVKKIKELQAQLAAWQTGKMHICLLCGRDKPCMTDEEAIAKGGPGAPCTFDPTPRELFDENKRLKAQLRQVEHTNARLRWLIRQVLTALPTKRDWLNPDIERYMNDQTAIADTDLKENT